MSAPVDVAVAVLIRSDGAALLAQRPASKVYSGYWEFPGGKIEPGEPVAEALRREIREELGIEIERAYPWITRVFSYPHAKVRLHFYRVYSWRGEPRAIEHRAIAWQRPDAIELDPLLPANGPVIRNLMLPSEYAITRAREVGADGVHLTAEQLRSAPARPDFPWCGASCHSSEELRRAEALGVDFVVLGPVRATPSHPDAVPLGWERFREIAAGAAVPVYALGGIVTRDLEQALHCGAHGIAMVRGSWGEIP